ncbi:hypothetical protein O181_063501 [Austropuccinia psidii MF-1]|uniref:Uncharacterized protein n=1 Tax=Austropuccinia psidii MF-1 TaxID=1389203 RepID=A0A9Q3EK56_9BASI|nr:hypothetical protein [Austropuccinia psidii MF-1]
MPTQHAFDAAYHPYARSAVLKCLPCCLPSLCLQCPPDMPPTPLTILMLVWCPRPQDETMMPPPPYLLRCLQFLCSHGATLNPPYA